MGREEKQFQLYCGLLLLLLEIHLNMQAARIDEASAILKCHFQADAFTNVCIKKASRHYFFKQ